IVLENKAQLEGALIPSGHMMINSLLRSRMSVAGWLSEKTGGVAQLYFLRELVEQIEADWAGVLENLESIRKLLINRKAMYCNVTVDKANWEIFQPQLTDFLKGLPAFDFEGQTWDTQVPDKPEGMTIPAQVNYVGKGANVYNLGYELHGSMSVIQKYISTTWLWEKVRVQGGAYGGMMSFDPSTGVFNYLSYRDPNLLGTLENYDGTPGFLKELELSESELSKSIIGAIGGLDQYQLPDAKGYTSLVRHLTGYTNQARQQYRDEVLSTTAKEFKAFAAMLDKVKENGKIVVLGSKEAIEEANEAQKDFLTINRVM
ncbi:MAG: peptidase M16, partial [Chloroflexota bacterium]